MPKLDAFELREHYAQCLAANTAHDSRTRDTVSANSVRSHAMHYRSSEVHPILVSDPSPLELPPVCIRALRCPSSLVDSDNPNRSIAFSNGQSRKLITHRLGDWSQRLFRSSPFRYGNSTSRLRGSLSSNRCASSGSNTNPMPKTLIPESSCRRSRQAGVVCRSPSRRLQLAGDAANGHIVQHERPSPCALS